MQHFIWLWIFTLPFTSCLSSVSYLKCRRALKDYESGRISREELDEVMDNYSHIPKSTFRPHEKLKTTGVYVCIEPSPDLVCLEDCPEELTEQDGEFEYFLIEFKEGGLLETRSFSNPRGDVFIRSDFFGKGIRASSIDSERYTSDGDLILQESVRLNPILMETYFTLVKSRLLHDGQLLYSPDISSARRICRHDPGIALLPDQFIVKSNVKPSW
jgi:hypothetical protein